MEKETVKHIIEGKEASTSEENVTEDVGCALRKDEIQEQKMAHYLQAWLPKTPDQIVVLNNKFQVQAINSAAVTGLKVASEGIIGRNCTKVLQCRNLNQTLLCGTSSCPLVQVFLQKKPHAQEDLIIGTVSSSSSEMSVSVTSVNTEEGPLAIFSMHNLSSIKVANFVRSNFISMVSHELCTPLNSVYGFIDLLLMGHVGKLKAEQQTFLDYAQEGVQQIISAVDDILFMTQADLGQFDIKQREEHFSNIVRAVVRTIQPQALKAEVELALDIPAETPSLYIDPLRIKQVLINLISNAIKFTPPGGTVTIHSHHYDEHFEIISVTDTGYGIPVADREHIFERFYQSHYALQPKMGGYGLGLSIAKLIIEQHGGAMGFESVLNSGTTFSFSVPRYSGRTDE